MRLKNLRVTLFLPPRMQKDPQSLESSTIGGHFVWRSVLLELVAVSRVYISGLFICAADKLVLAGADFNALTAGNIFRHLYG